MVFSISIKTHSRFLKEDIWSLCQMITYESPTFSHSIIYSACCSPTDSKWNILFLFASSSLQWKGKKTTKNTKQTNKQITPRWEGIWKQTPKQIPSTVVTWKQARAGWSPEYSIMFKGKAVQKIGAALIYNLN